MLHRYALWCWLAACLWVAACVGQGEPTGSVRVRVVDAAGKAPAWLRVIATSPDGRIAARTCPDKAPSDSDAVSCLRDGVEISLGDAELRLVVKARGFHHESVAIGPDTPEAAGGYDAEVVLRPLPAFAASEDYATGFEVRGGLEAFRAMAYSVDSELGPAEAVKFYIDDLGAAHPGVYFQNTRRHKLHYDFVRDVLGKAISETDFVAQTYKGRDRTAYAGTVVYYPAVFASSQASGGELAAPLALTFFSSDDLTPDQALVVHGLLEERLMFASLDSGQRRLVYLPAGEVQERGLAAEVAAFRQQDTLWLTWGELYGDLDLQILNPGLAYGTLRLLSAEEVATAVVSFHDILVLTGLPNDLPIVGGTITEARQTPLAHVNIAARSRGTPNIALQDASRDERIAPLLGQLVRFEVKDGAFALEGASLDEAQAFWDSRVPQVTELPFDVAFDGLPHFADLAFADSLRVGAKAANLAEIRAALPDQSPDGFAIPFHYYDKFMATSTVTEAMCGAARLDCEDEGRSSQVCGAAQALCAAGTLPEVFFDYAARVLADSEVRRDSALREAVLDGLRYHVRNTPVDPEFAALLDAEVASVFGDAKVRLRSSTNAEDLPGFSGAGLYESVGAYATGKEAASLEVRKVWASVWNWRAYEERSFFGIDHDSVRMGVAVSTAFPDERANGVLITQNIADPLVAGMYVNVQVGEVPVTNPVGGALPEVFSIIASPGGLQVARQRYSSLSPGEPLLTDDEIIALYGAAFELQRRFASLYEADPYGFALDVEFKFHGPQRALFIKQARPYSRSSQLQ